MGRLAFAAREASLGVDRWRPSERTVAAIELVFEHTQTYRSVASDRGDLRPGRIRSRR